jgi:predicted DsbA family dithiol-disulfide isomerase
VTVRIDHWSDPLCIWAYVGQSRLDRLLEAWGASVRVHYRVVPVFGSVPWRFTQGSWAAAGPEGRALATARTAARFGAPAEVDGRVWLDDPPASSWAPGAAIKAVALMEAEGLAPDGAVAAYQVALRRALFEQHRNTARRDVFLDVAGQQALDVDALTARLDDGRAVAALFEDHQERERLGLQGSPTYVFDDGRIALYGNVAEDVLHATVAALVAGDVGGGSRC